jgi:hypothetical protein
MTYIRPLSAAQTRSLDEKREITTAFEFASICRTQIAGNIQRASTASLKIFRPVVA